MTKKLKLSDDWVVPFAIIFLCCIAFISTRLHRDGDFFFMVANGDYILHHGFPSTNPFVMHEGLKIVIQQWIPSVIIYAFSGHLWGFLMTEAIFGLFLLVYTIYKVFSIYDGKHRSFLMASIMVSLMLYMFLGKPMLYSMILLVMQFYICEKKKSWLWLPLIVMAEANIHASFIAFHFVYLLPYIFPGFTKLLKNTADYRYIKAVPLMAIASLINPYGLDGALYLFNSYGKVLKEIGIGELKTISPKTAWGCATIIALLYIAQRIYACYIKPRVPIDSHRFYTFAGSLLLLILFPQSRNHIFVLIGSIPLIAATIPKGFKGKMPSVKIIWAIALCCVFATVISIPMTSSKLPTGTPNSIEYLKDKPSVLYTSFDGGSYFEMKGYKVFVDARPELYFKKLNKKENIIDDFKAMISTDDEQITATIEKYGFTHFNVHRKPIVNKHLKKYLTDNGYKIVAKDEDFYLYESPDYDPSTQKNVSTPM